MAVVALDTVEPASASVPALGACSSTDAKLLASPLASMKPKSARVSVRLPFWAMPIVALVPLGASLTGVTDVRATTSAALTDVLPPLLPTLTVAPEVTLAVVSISRSDRLLGAPL